VSFAIGFQDAGHEVWFLEDSGDYPWCYDPDTEELDPSARYGVRFMADEMAAVGLDDRWVFRHGPSGRHDGMSAERTADVLREADVFVNVSLTTPMRAEYLQIPHRLAVDTDPVFTQVRIAQGDGLLAGVAESHTRLFTFGRPPLPGQQHAWVPTRQPVVSRFWPVAPPTGHDPPFTTIMSWQAYPPVVHDGIEYAAKDKTSLDVLDLPALTDARLSIALGGGDNHWEARRLFGEHGWEITDPMEANGTSARFRRFLAGSAGEIGIAKHGYVAARSGWFSERTCCYLASGRPAVVSDTGWSEWLPTGEGVFGYTTAAEAARAIEAIRADPERHGRAARKFVEEHFAAAEVCDALLAAL
jgi:hypothetical protein